jgi:hypothetical protein
MIRRTLSTAVPLAVLVLAGCGSPPADPAPAGLAWAVPSSPTVVYARGDTAEVEVDAGGQVLEISVESRAVLDVGFEPAGPGVRVTAALREFAASMSNPMAPSQSIDESSIRGDLVFSMDRTGRVSDVQAPAVEGIAAQMFSAEEIATSLFPRLPARPVEPGTTWVDTLSVESEEESGSIRSTSVVSYTVAGDTTVAGRTLLRVELVSEEERRVDGTQGGMEINQDLSGTSEGWFLWDRARGLLVESYQTSSLAGTMAVSAAPFPFPVEVEGEQIVRLQEEVPEEGR